MEVKVGDYYRVISGYPARQDASWIHTGDLVKVIGVYPYVILVEQVKEGYCMRECFSKQTMNFHLVKSNGGHYELC